MTRQVLADAQSTAAGGELYPTKGKKPNWAASLEALVPLVNGNMPGLFEANLDREIDRTFHLADDFSFKEIIVGGRDAYQWIPQLKDRRIPVILTADLGSEPSVAPAAAG